jgi:hypothetical protein
MVIVVTITITVIIIIIIIKQNWEDRKIPEIFSSGMAFKAWRNAMT